MRLRPIVPQETPEDLDDINPDNFLPDPTRRHHAEPRLFDDQLPNLFEEPTPPATPSPEPHSGRVQVRICVPLAGAPAAPVAVPGPLVPPAPGIQAAGLPDVNPDGVESQSDSSSSDSEPEYLELDQEQIDRLPIDPNLNVDRRGGIVMSDDRDHHMPFRVAIAGSASRISTLRLRE